ncbi:hypothetical protein H671_6g16515 [Cricetulus griseus]|nr:hypothetical protein H671_6g16515 [Cricetulus griseus]
MKRSHKLCFNLILYRQNTDFRHWLRKCDPMDDYPEKHRTQTNVPGAGEGQRTLAAEELLRKSQLAGSIDFGNFSLCIFKAGKERTKSGDAAIAGLSGPHPVCQSHKSSYNCISSVPLENPNYCNSRYKLKEALLFLEHTSSRKHNDQKIHSQ